MDQGLKESKYKPYNVDVVPEASIYSGPNSGDAINGIPLYPEDTAANPQLRRFVVQGCQDLWAAVLFIATLIMTVIWGSFNIAMYKLISLDNRTRSTARGTGDYSDTKNPATVAVALVVILVISVCAAFASLMLLRMFPRQLIYIANALTVVITLISAVLAFVAGVIFAGVLLIIMCLLQALWLYCVRDRIPFSAELLKASSDILSRYKAIFVFNFFLSILCAIYVFFWSSMAMPPADRVNNGVSSTGDSLLITFYMLCIFWAIQVVPNLMHVTTAGVTATWYFAGEGQMPRNPTLHSFKRAATTSFGSVCFGSLIVAFIRLLRWLAQSSGDNENAFIRCIAACILQCLESLVEYFNTYAFVHVAVYGCSYIEAAKRTWALCKQCFFAAYFNDALVGTTLALLSLGVSALVGIATGLILYSIAFGVTAFIISLLVHSLFFSAVESSVTTLFVCFAEMPEGLQHSAPTLYAALHDTDQNGTNNNAMHP